jgi:hypothetical protein
VADLRVDRRVDPLLVEVVVGRLDRADAVGDVARRELVGRPVEAEALDRLGEPVLGEV